MKNIYLAIFQTLALLSLGPFKCKYFFCAAQVKFTSHSSLKIFNQYQYPLTLAQWVASSFRSQLTLCTVLLLSSEYTQSFLQEQKGGAYNLFCLV